MRRSSPILFFLSMSPVAAIVALLAFVAFPLPARSQQFKILHGFGSGTDGAGLWGSLAFDGKGNLYGTTYAGGEYDDGTVYQLMPNDDGAWTENVVHSFDYYSDPLGAEPTGWVVLDALSNIYGGTAHGGGGYGAVFELTPEGPGGWTGTAIYSVVGPYGGLTLDNAGNLFGDAGGVFEVSPGPDGWTESTLCTIEGCNSLAGVILDSHGNIYGANTAYGSQKNVVYQVSLRQSTWQLKVLHTFNGPPDGEGYTFGQLAMDASGNLYGATSGGGECCGIIYELSPQPGGHWKQTILYDFQDGATGHAPAAGVTLDPAGNIYGTTGYGGGSSDCGVVYKLAPSGGGAWTYSVLHTFTGNDGCLSEANLILDARGHLYGTTTGGGPYGGGVVFEIVP